MYVHKISLPSAYKLSAFCSMADIVNINFIKKNLNMENDIMQAFNTNVGISPEGKRLSLYLAGAFGKINYFNNYFPSSTCPVFTIQNYYCVI